jgi:Bacterial Ig-like domain (group 2)
MKFLAASSVVLLSLSCAILLSCGGIAVNQTSTLTLTRLTVSPVNQTIAKGTYVQLTATGSFSNGTQSDLTSSVAWRVTPSTVATVNDEGKLQGIGEGNAQVIATYQDVTGNSSVTVGPPALLQLAVAAAESSLPIGESDLLTATGIFSDGSMQNLTQSVSWQANPSSIATISDEGELKALEQGTVQIAATYQGVTGTTSVTVGAATLVSIEVTAPDASLPLGESEALTAIGTFSDSTTKNLTHSLAWTSSRASVAAVNPSGEVTGDAIGAATVSASLGNIAGSTTLTIIPAVIVALQISPAQQTVLIGTNTQFRVVAQFSNGTTKTVTSTVVWSSAPLGVIEISKTGLATTERTGLATISASNSGLTASAILNVMPLTTVAYFNRSNAASSGSDGTIRLTNPSSAPICAMVYVFDRTQELEECCGCKIVDNQLLTLSLIHDLTANTLTGKMPVAGTIEVTPSDPTSGGECNPAAPAPDNIVLGWETNVQSSTQASMVTEIPLATTPLSQSEAEALAAQCGAIQQLGGGAGTCSCGQGNTVPDQ